MRRLLSASILSLLCIASAGAAKVSPGAPKSAPLIAPAQTFVGAQSDKMMDVIAAGIEADIKANKNALGGFKPFRESASLVFFEARLDLQATLSANVTSGRRET